MFILFDTECFKESYKSYYTSNFFIEIFLFKKLIQNKGPLVSEWVMKSNIISFNRVLM